MASQVPDAALATPITSATSPVSFDSSTTTAESPLALEPEVEASAPPDGVPPQLTDDILRQVMEKRGTRNGRIVQDVLATAPYNISMSYEVVRQRVKKLLEKESTSTNKHAGLDNSTSTTSEDSEKPAEKEKVRETSGEGGDNEKEQAEERDRAAVARDLGMLADTVRSIVTAVVGSEAPSVDEEKDVETVEEVGEREAKTSSIETPDDAEVNVEVMADTAIAADVVSETDKSSDSSTQVMDITEVVLADADGVIQEMAQDAGDTDRAVALPSSNDSDECSDGLAADVKSSKRPAVETGAPSHAPKRQKRAEYSMETRALCVRRHQAEGVSYATISKELGIPHDSVRAIVRKAKRTGSVASAPRSGRPRKTSGIVDKVILEAVRSNKQCSAKTIQEELLRVYGVKLSPETVRRRVLEHTKQRIQSISGGTSSEATPLSTVVEENSAPASTVVHVAPVASSQGELIATEASLPDTASFQQLLHGEGQSTSDDEQRIGSSEATISPATEVTESAIPTSRLPSPAPAEDVAAAAAVAPEGVQPATPSQRDDEPSIQKQHNRGEYSIETREQCVALHAQGQGYRRIGKALNMPHTTVRAIVEKAQRTGTVLPAKRSGRPRKTDAIIDKVILQAVQANEKSSARIIKEQLQAAYGVRVSCETIRRRVKDHRRQCMSASASTATSDMLPNSAEATLVQQQELLAVTMASSSAALMTYDKDGVHI